jgi:hypothetical protein
MVRRARIAPRLWQQRALCAGALVVVTAYLVDASLFNRKQWYQSFVTAPPTEAISQEFHQVRGNRTRMFAYPRANLGTLDCFEESPLPISASLRPNLPADEYPADPAAGTVTRVSWSPNEIAVTADFRYPGRVVVNQNFDRHWRVEGGELVSQDGLLAADVSAGEHLVRFSYLPLPFLIGLVITLLSLLGLAWIWWRWRPA